MIEFGKSLLSDKPRVDREEDTGSENLRKAKMSYNPIFPKEKFPITL